jgi:hypothetical protein
MAAMRVHPGIVADTQNFNSSLFKTAYLKFLLLWLQPPMLGRTP